MLASWRARPRKACGGLHVDIGDCHQWAYCRATERVAGDLRASDS
jgi:hypothetical protein